MGAAPAAAKEALVQVWQRLLKERVAQTIEVPAGKDLVWRFVYRIRSRVGGNEKAASRKDLTPFGDVTAFSPDGKRM